MNAQEIKATLAEINRKKYELEAALEENGGELTPELLQSLEILEDLKALLAGDGVDDLGRWLKSVQDEIAARKAEADAAARKVKALKGQEDYVKFLIGQALDAIGAEKVKGQYYGFTRKTSTTNKVAQEELEAAYNPAILAALGDLLPGWLHIQLKTTATELKDAGGDALAFLETTEAPAIGFTKPRASKEA
jgi:hypothetical protein